MNNDYFIDFDLGEGTKKVSLQEIASFFNVDYDILLKYYIEKKDIKEALIKVINKKEKKQMMLDYLYDFGIDGILYSDKEILIEVYNNVASKMVDNPKYNRLITYYNNLKNKKEENLNQIKYDNTYEGYKAINNKELELLIINTDKKFSNIKEQNEYSETVDKLLRLLLKILSGKNNIDLSHAIKLIDLLTDNEKDTLKIISKALVDKELLLTKEQYAKLSILINTGCPSKELNNEIFNNLLNEEYINKKENNNIKTR